MMLSVTAMGQTHAVKGTVVDEKGEPIPGASVIIEGTTTGTITDIDGNWTLNVEPGAKIQVSFIGYDKESLAIQDGIADYKVTLHDEMTEMDEIVVVGYGVQKKATLTGSVATVDTEAIQDLSAGGLGSTLSGLVNGLSVSGGDGRPGENAQIYIRDTNSLSDVGSTAQQPLFVIDGYIYPNDIKVGNTTQNYGAEAFNNLDPSVIESISVLKDASAAVYGARAANGVILVTTKKGHQGEPVIAYGGTFGITNWLKKPEMLSAYEYGKLYNAVIDADPTKSGNINRTTELFQADELEAMKGLDYDLLDEYWKVGFTQQHSVTVSGAGGNASYFGGVSYFNQDGNLGKLDYQRWNYRAGVDLTIATWVKANLTVSGDNGKKNKPNVKVGGSNQEKEFLLLLTHPRYIPEYVDGKPVASFGPSNKQNSAEQLYHFDTLQNNGDYSNTVNQNTTFNAGIEYDFGWNEYVKGLKLKLTYSKSISTDKGNEYGSDFTVYQLTNRSGSGQHLYTPVSGTDYSTVANSDNMKPITYSNGNPSYLSRNGTRTDNYQVNFTATYNRQFGKHDVGLLFSIEKGEAESEYLYGAKTDPYSFTTHQYNSVKETSEASTQFTRSESGSLSYIGRANYNYDGKYLVEFLLRADASTKFAPNNYWGKFPSGSLGWVVSKEDWFVEKLPWIDFLKLRASFGLTGRDNTSPWQWMQVYAQDANRGAVFGASTGAASGSRITINKNNSAVNRDVHWDKSYKGNIGVDFNFMEDHIAVTFDHYRNWNREMLMNIQRSVPGTVGTQSAAVNLGEMDTWGYELSVTYKDKIGEDFKYSATLQTGYSDNKVKVMDFDNEYTYRKIHKNERSDIGSWGMQCIGMFRSFQDIEEYFDTYNITSYMGLAKKDVRPGMLIYKDIRGAQQPDGSYAGPDGIVDVENDQVRLSNRSNPYGATLNLKASWKGISFNTQFNVSWGGYSFVDSRALKFLADKEYTNMPSFWNPDDMFVYQDITDGSGNTVMRQNRNGSMPNLAYASVNSTTSSFWRISGTRAKWNRVTIGYTFPKDWVQKLHVKNARLNVTGQNLLSFYNPLPKKFMDPMSAYGKYPTLRKWTIGLNVSF